MGARDHQTSGYSALLATARRRLLTLGLAPPFDMDALRGGLERARGTTIAIVPTDELPVGAAFGLTGRQGEVEVILHESRTDLAHQRVIILHEFAHMLLEHPPSAVLHSQEPEMATFREIDASLVASTLEPDQQRWFANAPATKRRAWRRWLTKVSGRARADQLESHRPRGPYGPVYEWEAETLATILLGWTEDAATTGASPDELAVHRLTDALGHRWSPR